MPIELLTQFQLNTKRTICLPLLRSDLDIFVTINQNDSVKKYLWDGETIADNTAAEILTTNEVQFEQQHSGLWKILDRSTHRILGYAGLWYFFEETQPQLLYVLLPEFEHQGYASEVALALVDYAFQKLKFSYLTAAMDVGHRASEAVATRIGMVKYDERMENGKPTVFYRINNRGS